MKPEVFYDYLLALASAGVVEAETYGEQELWRGIERSLKKNAALKPAFVRKCNPKSSNRPDPPSVSSEQSWKQLPRSHLVLGPSKKRKS